MHLEILTTTHAAQVQLVPQQGDRLTLVCYDGSNAAERARTYCKRFAGNEYQEIAQPVTIAELAERYASYSGNPVGNERAEIIATIKTKPAADVAVFVLDVYDAVKANLGPTAARNAMQQVAERLAR